MPHLEGFSPIVPVSDVAASAEFYIGKLGFELRNNSADWTYALVARDEAAVILIGPADAENLRATGKHISAYVWVSDIDALYAELEARLAGLPAGRVRPPFAQPYGMREFHVKDPDGFLLLFGQAV